MKYLWDMHKISCSVSWEEQSFSPVTTALRGDAHWNSHRLVKKYGNNGQKSIYALAWSTNVPEWIFKKPQALWLLFVKNARTHLHENNLTDCLVAHTRSYACGLMDEHRLHTWCSFLLHIECLVSCCMWQKTSNRNRCIVPRRKVTDLHPEVLPAQTNITAIYGRQIKAKADHSRHSEDCTVTMRKKKFVCIKSHVMSPDPEHSVHMNPTPCVKWLQWSSGSVLPLSTQVRGFKPGIRIFQGEKILSMPSFGREVKPWVPCRRFAACKRSLNWRGSRNFRQNYRLILAHTVPPFTTRISRVVVDVGGTWQRMWERPNRRGG